MNQFSALTSVEEALAAILQHAKPLEQYQQLELTQALGKTLAHDVVSPMNVPTENNSAMDGYAINLADLNSSEAMNDGLAISQRIAAGQAAAPLRPGTCARIFTGAPLPLGSNAVVMQEACTVTEQRVIFPAHIESGNNIRLAGSDISQGSCLLRKGHRLAPQDLGLLASIGVEKVAVIAPLKVAILATGDELVEPGEALSSGKISLEFVILLGEKLVT